jgi:FkbM family methyltransferase
MIKKISKRLFLFLFSILKSDKSFIKYFIEKCFNLFDNNPDKESQEFFEMIFNKSLKKMNYGNGGSISESGELYVLEYIKSKITGKSIVLFDVGANIGNYSKELIQTFIDKNFQLHSFEPSPITYGLLCNNINDNRVILNNVGLGDKDETKLLYSNEDCSGLASIYQRNLEHFNIKMSNTESVEIICLDNYCKRHNVSTIDFLKLDIEGHELKALYGAKDMLDKRKIKFVQFEFGGCNIDSKTFFQDIWYLLHVNYNIYRILQNGLILLPEYKETYEIFTTVNYLAELKEK